MRVKIAFKPYRLTTIHPLQTDDGRRTDDDRRQLYHKLDRYLSTVG